MGDSDDLNTEFYKLLFESTMELWPNVGVLNEKDKLSNLGKILKTVWSIRQNLDDETIHVIYPKIKMNFPIMDITDPIQSTKVNYQMAKFLINIDHFDGIYHWVKDH